MAVTAGTLFDSTLFAAETLALGADDGSLQGELGDLAAVDILKSDLVSMVDCASFGGATLAPHASEHATHATHAAKATTTTKELSKQILGGHATAASTTFQASLAILVVDASLLGVGQNLVGV
jgi:hypothetical protein